MAKKKVRAAGNEAEKVDFEKSLGELESIVFQLERGDLGLSEALTRYEEGIGHLKQCHAELARVSRRIEILSGVDAAGNPIAEPYDELQYDSLEEKQHARSRRRTDKSTTKGSDASVDDDLTLF